ncbi:uncharacterized protein LTR77_008837 [Saxophila tyrrhenica]|uniref:Glycoside hydrolase family 76 protein n=1 Tax=Saxophila tyrrhenica TaxID=1690608 RepID=A0AAV9P3A0_9PEZI|nr:hypothetical protein LTR77_008837 [Saxophila tyrrhenica]
MEARPCLTAAFLHLLLSICLLASLPLTSAAICRPRHSFVLGSGQLRLHEACPPPTNDGENGHEPRYGIDSASKPIASAVLENLRDAVHVMQTTWFDVPVGSWATAIDWTRAVIDTHLVATISTLSRTLDRAPRAAGGIQSPRLGDFEVENEINHYFAQNIAYYFGENAFRIRNEAYDDMLWVVLGWLESVKFIRRHSQQHYEADINGRIEWHGIQFIAAFVHRARVFYDLASRGWDEKFCGGGMVWNPNLGPYKNAITNEQYIAASIGMYLYFPGENNSSPFLAEESRSGFSRGTKPFEKAYLRHAVDGYFWLRSSGMTNHRGLYVDGFHIANWRTNGTACDERTEMVYTYNQGVLLSGLRGLWEGTGNSTYLEDGHELVRHVFAATGWDAELQRATSADWAGLGRNGILEDHCDAAGNCTQDAQTFKSIFFHHLTLLCEPLPLEAVVPGKTHSADRTLAHLHRRSCENYAPWVAHNAKAALETRDKHGRFGMWWGANSELDPAPLPIHSIDYRNNASETFESVWAPGAGFSWSDSVRRHPSLNADGTYLDAVPGLYAAVKLSEGQQVLTSQDLNDRGRGRTVETQAGGVAVLRCLWELLSLP